MLKEDVAQNIRRTIKKKKAEAVRRMTQKFKRKGQDAEHQEQQAKKLEEEELDLGDDPDFFA